MPKININDEVFYNILKLVGAVIILYFGLTLNVFHIGEKISMTEDLLQKQSISVSQDLQNEIKDLIGKHNTSKVLSGYSNISNSGKQALQDIEYKMKFQKICDSNILICNKIKFEGDYSYKDKYMYLATAIYVINKISDNIQLGKSIFNQLDEITINNEIGKRRGYATWDTVVINLGTVSSYSEYFELLGHELGHVVDLGIVRGFSRVKSHIYTEFGRSVFEKDDPSLIYYALSWQSEKVRKPESVKDDFCSGYGMSDPFEDFAECHNLYLNHNAIFKEMAKNNIIMRKKYNFMANLYAGKYFFNSRDDLEKMKYNTSWRPWDTTRIQ